MPSEPRVVDGDTVPRSIGRVLDLLEIVLSEPRNLTAAAQAAGLTPTTALRHLRALEARGYVTRDDSNTYAAGPTLRRLAAALRDGGPLDRLVAAAQPVLDELAAATGESAYLAIGDGRVATYVATAESERSIRHVGWIGQTVTLEGTAVGAAFHTPGRCTIRVGAVEPDIAAISYGLPPIGPLSAAISLIGPSHRFGRTERAGHETAVVEAATELTQRLGVDHGDRELVS